MSRTLGRRLLLAAISASMVITVVGAPASAARPTLWVDDGGNEGPAACQGVQPYTSIQDAIDAAAPGSRIHVCPGTYEEQLRIDKERLLVRSIRGRQAVLLTPSDLASTELGSVMVVVDEADGTVVRGFDVLVRSAGPCERLDAAFLVYGADQVKLRGNRVRVWGEDTLGGCGYLYGVAIVSGISVSAAPALLIDPDRTQVLFNRIRDFQAGGILVEGMDAHARVWRNQLLYFHLHEEFGIRSAGIPCSSGLNCLFPLPFGVGVESDASAVIRGNLIKSGPDACVQCTLTATTTEATHALFEAISLIGAGPDDTNRIIKNVSFRTSFGIRLQDSHRVFISRNEITQSRMGIELDTSTLNGVTQNHVTDNWAGIQILSGSNDNAVTDNDFLGNDAYDCGDDTTGTGTEGTANTWTGNAGEPDSPDGICDADDAP